METGENNEQQRHVQQVPPQNQKLLEGAPSSLTFCPLEPLSLVLQ